MSHDEDLAFKWAMLVLGQVGIWTLVCRPLTITLMAYRDWLRRNKRLQSRAAARKSRRGGAEQLKDDGNEVPVDDDSSGSDYDDGRSSLRQQSGPGAPSAEHDAETGERGAIRTNTNPMVVDKGLPKQAGTAAASSEDVWDQHVDPSTGHPYEINRRTNQSRWKLTAAAASVATAASAVASMRAEASPGGGGGQQRGEWTREAAAGAEAAAAGG